MAAIRLLIDEDVRPLLAQTLRDRSYDARHVVELGRAGRSDVEQLRYATAEGRALLTHNVRDYVVLDREYRASGRRHGGILVWDQVPFRAFVRRTLRCRTRLDAAAARDRVVWLQDFK